MINPIASKFNLGNSAVILILLLVFGGYSYFSDKEALSKQLEEQVNSSLTRLKTSLPSTIWNYETEQLEKIVRAELTVTITKGILVYDDKQLLFGEQKSENGELQALT